MRVRTHNRNYTRMRVNDMWYMRYRRLVATFTYYMNWARGDEVQFGHLFSTPPSAHHLPFECMHLVVYGICRGICGCLSCIIGPRAAWVWCGIRWVWDIHLLFGSIASDCSIIHQTKPNGFRLIDGIYSCPGYLPACMCV